MSGLNTQLSPSMSLTMHPPPTVASGLSWTYKFTTLFAEVQEPSATLPPPTVPTAFPSPELPPCLPCTEVTPIPAQEPVFSSHPPHRSTLSLSISLTGPNTVPTPTVPYSPSLLRSGDATAEGSPGVAFESTTYTGAVLPPHDEPLLIIGHDGKGVPGQSERSESFELVSRLSISAVNGAGRSDHIDLGAWCTNFAGLDQRL